MPAFHILKQNHQRIPIESHPLKHEQLDVKNLLQITWAMFHQIVWIS